MPFYDYIRIRGIQSDYPTAEGVQGIGSVSAGASGSPENPINFSGSFSTEKEYLDGDAESALETYFTDVLSWFTSQQAKLDVAYTQWYAGEEIEPPEIELPPTLDLSIQQGWGYAIDAFIWLAKIASKLLLYYFFQWFCSRVQQLSANKELVDAFFVDEDGEKVPVLALINEGIQDLSLVDAVVDFGGFKVHIVGKALRK